jgi:hypothetical protein
MKPRHVKLKHQRGGAVISTASPSTIDPSSLLLQLSANPARCHDLDFVASHL